MARRDWYIGIGLLTAAVVVHALFPRYEWRGVPENPYQMVRIDRWRGTAHLGIANFGTGGEWVPVRQHQ